MLTVSDAGLFTTVQDCGRWGYQGYGVPVSGAMDLFALCVANALVDNSTNLAALEIHSPVALQSDDPHLLALTGAEGSFQIDGRWMPQWTSVFARAGSHIEIAPTKAGGWLYLAIHGGIAAPHVLGSRSTLARGDLLRKSSRGGNPNTLESKDARDDLRGGLGGRVIETSDVIRVDAATSSDFVGAAGKSIGDRARSFAQRDALVRVVLGPHYERFSAKAIEHLTQTEYVVTVQADRMGYRLSGLPLARRGENELVSCGVPLGAIQVPPDGLPIVLMADHQTTGGYPIIATVISADVALVAQRAMGQAVRFRTIMIDEAQQAWNEMWEIISGL